MFHFLRVTGWVVFLQRKERNARNGGGGVQEIARNRRHVAPRCMKNSGGKSFWRLVFFAADISAT